MAAKGSLMKVGFIGLGIMGKHGKADEQEPAESGLRPCGFGHR